MATRPADNPMGMMARKVWFFNGDDNDNTDAADDYDFLTFFFFGGGPFLCVNHWLTDNDFPGWVEQWDGTLCTSSLTAWQAGISLFIHHILSIAARQADHTLFFIFCD